MNALIKADHAMPLAYDDIERLAASIAKSGLFGIKTTDQAIALMMIAHAEGRHPALAARDYDIIQGRPAKKAEAMLRDFLDAGGKVQWHKLDDTMADASFSHPAGGTVRISWDMERATKAQLNTKDNYKKFPRQMLRSRTVSEGVRTVWPLATSGFYVPEEAVEFAGQTIDAEPEVAPRANGRDAINAEVPLRAAVPPTDPTSWLKPLDEPNGTIWLKNLDVLLANAETQDEVVQIGDHHSVGAATAKAPPAVQARISEMLAKAFGRFVQPEVAVTSADATEDAPADEVAQ